MVSGSSIAIAHNLMIKADVMPCVPPMGHESKLKSPYSGIVIMKEYVPGTSKAGLLAHFVFLPMSPGRCLGPGLSTVL